MGRSAAHTMPMPIGTTHPSDVVERNNAIGGQHAITRSSAVAAATARPIPDALLDSADMKGSIERTLLLASLRVRVRSFDGEDRAVMERRYGAFVGPGEPDVTLDIRHEPQLRQPQPPNVEWPGTLAEPLDGGFVFAREGERLTVNAAFSEATLVVARDPADVADGIVDHRSSPAESALRILVASKLPERGGAVFHAAGYADERGAIFFPGASGIGKTTLARKLSRDRVLSDDQVAVVGETAYALPFVGDLGPPIQPRTAPLRAIAFLERGEPSRQRLSPVMAVTRATTCAPWFLREPEASRVWLDAVSAIVTRVPCFVLRTERDEPIAPHLDFFLG
jgi:hypothetical protein